MFRVPYALFVCQVDSLSYLPHLSHHINPLFTCTWYVARYRLKVSFSCHLPIVHASKASRRFRFAQRSCMRAGTTSRHQTTNGRRCVKTGFWTRRRTVPTVSPHTCCDLASPSPVEKNVGCLNLSHLHKPS